MNKLFFALIFTVLLSTSCVTVGDADGGLGDDWPMLSKQIWEKMTPERLGSFIESVVAIDEVGAVGFTALMLAAELNDNPDVVEYLISEGANPDFRTRTGQTALMSAALNEYTDEMIVALAENGADVNIENEYGLTPLSASFMFSSRPENTMRLLSFESSKLQMIIPAGSDINYRTSRGYNILMLELRNNCDSETAEALIGEGVDLSARDAAGWSAGTIAAVYNTHPEVLELLYEHSVDFHVSGEENFTTLMLASARNIEPDIISLLIENGENINAATDSGYTPLMFAACVSLNDEIVSMLINAGADVSMKTIAGTTAWGFIQSNEALKGSRGYWELNDRLFE